jgi:filamin
VSGVGSVGAGGSGFDGSGAGGAGGGGAGAGGAAPHVGAETTVYIQALDYEVAGREVAGREPICLRLLSPSGVSANVPLRLSKDRARFRATVRWPEVGNHVLVASLNGDAVVGSPLQVSVVAADVHLPVCKVSGNGSSKCKAGERTQFSIEARDSRGNRLLAGGASLTLQVQAPGQEPMRGSVLDQGDGTYTSSYAVDQAGPYLLVLASQSSRLALEGLCEPGPTDVTKCRVDSSGLSQLSAGTRGDMRIIRADRFGNVIPAGPDMLPFRVEASGVGPAEVETVEAGNGACEVRFEARVAGRYTLHVWSGYKRDAVAGSPFDVVVLPGQAASSSCVAHLEGTQLHGPGVTAAIAGEPLTVRMQARDRFGNPTAWKRWQTLSVAASGPQEVIFQEAELSEGGGGGGAVLVQVESS